MSMKHPRWLADLLVALGYWERLPMAVFICCFVASDRILNSRLIPEGGAGWLGTRLARSTHVNLQTVLQA